MAKDRPLLNEGRGQLAGVELQPKHRRMRDLSGRKVLLSKGKINGVEARMKRAGVDSLFKNQQAGQGKERKFGPLPPDEEMPGLGPHTLISFSHVRFAIRASTQSRQ